MKVKDITAAIEAFAPLNIQEGWDNSGLCIGSPEDEVHGVLLGFDCTAELIDEAVAAGCDMVVTHHPLIFKGLKRIQGGDPVSDAVIRAVKAGVAVYAAHTTADKVIAGVSGAMARRLGLQDVAIMEEDGGYGFGAVGNLPCQGKIRAAGRPGFETRRPGGARGRVRRVRRVGDRRGPRHGRPAVCFGGYFVSSFLHAGGIYGAGYRPLRERGGHCGHFM